MTGIRRLIHGWCSVVLAGVLLGCATPAPAVAPPPSANVLSTAGIAAPGRVPVLAYYYLWFDRRSWSRAKVDYPLLGRYSSDDAGVIREHIRAARSAGITGFIVSWKDTGLNDRRLELLMRLAGEQHFTLAMIYQGLDFARRPLPVRRVTADLRLFVDRYASDPVFGIFDRPLVVWSGTWMFSRAEIAAATAGVRGRVKVLATEKSVRGYQRIADLVDGDAYYWSSVDPSTNRGYPAKLRAMADAVHAEDGCWIAPFAPGFDARLVGGTRSVSRRDGATLRAEYRAAAGSDPDALGLISWNEFSENTHVEPSTTYGDRALRVLRALTATGDGPPTGDSDETGDASGVSRTTAFRTIGVIAALLLVGAGAPFVLRRRSRRR